MILLNNVDLGINVITDLILDAVIALLALIGLRPFILRQLITHFLMAEICCCSNLLPLLVHQGILIGVLLLG